MTAKEMRPALETGRAFSKNTKQMQIAKPACNGVETSYWSNYIGKP